MRQNALVTEKSRNLCHDFRWSTDHLDYYITKHMCIYAQFIRCNENVGNGNDPVVGTGGLSEQAREQSYTSREQSGRGDHRAGGRW